MPLLTPADHTTLLRLLDNLGDTSIKKAGDYARQVDVFMKSRKLRWEDLLVNTSRTPAAPAPQIPDQDGPVDPNIDELDLLNQCLPHIERLTEYEQNFVVDKIDSIGKFGYLNPNQHRLLMRIVKKLRLLKLIPTPTTTDPQPKTTSEELNDPLPF